MSSPAAESRVDHGVAVNPSQIASIDSEASSERTTQQSRPAVISEYFLPADYQLPRTDSSKLTTLTTASIPPANAPVSLPADTPKGRALQAALGVSRLPASGLVLCGRKWLLGAEDMLIPAACSLLSDLFVLLLAVVTIALLPSSRSSFPSSCSTAEFTKLQSSVIALLVLLVLLTAVDVGTMLSAWYSDMFRRNRLVPTFLYLRMILSVLIAAAALAAAVFYFSTVRNDCTLPYGRTLDLSCLALFVSSLLMIAFLFCYFCVSYGLGQLCAPREEDSWRLTLSKWFRRQMADGGDKAAEGEHDVFSSVATIFAEFFSSSLPSSSIHVVPSDVAVALCLVQGQQKRRRRQGERMYVAAGKRRWDTAYIEQYYAGSLARADEEERRRASGETQAAGDTTAEHAALQQSLRSTAARHDAPLPVKSSASPYNAYSKGVKEEEQATAKAAEQETLPAPPPTQPAATAAAAAVSHRVPIGFARTEEEEARHEQHLAHGPSFQDKDEEDRRVKRNSLLQRSGSQLAAQQERGSGAASGIAELTEVVTDDGQLQLLEEKAGSRPHSSSGDAGEDVNPFECGDNIAGEDEEDMADVALSGRQPRLLPMDWEKIAEGRHYYDFACGSYGWMLYTFNHLHTIATCALCRRSTPINADEMEGSGCRPLPCCFPSWKTCLLSVRAFELQSGVASREILYCHLDAAPVYYVVVDRQKKSLVVSVRGTLSVADALIDLDAQLASLAPFGYPRGYTHQGILQNAVHCRDHIDRKGVVASFLRLNPDYALVIVGHSLGAGTAAALTFILRSRFAEREGTPPYSADAHLTGGGAQADRARKEAGDLPSPSRPGPHASLPADGAGGSSSSSSSSWYRPRSLHCFIYGCPLLVDPLTAQSPFAMSSITCFIYHDDMVARMSLASMFALKQQMVEAYERSENRKWKIMRLAWGSQWEKLDKYDVKQQRQHNRRQLRLRLRHTQAQAQSSSGSGTAAQGQGVSSSDGTISAATNRGVPPTVELQSIAVRGEDGTQYPDDALRPAAVTAPASGGGGAEGEQGVASKSASTQPIQVTTTAIEEQHYTAADGQRMTRVTEKKSTFSLHLRKMYLPGRIYLLLPVKKNRAGAVQPPQRSATVRRPGWDADVEDDGSAADPGCCVGQKKRWVIFPAAHESFGEIIVSGHMFNDHVPVLSAWTGLNLPARYRDKMEDTK